MADIKQGRWTAEIDGDFVVFIIGARIKVAGLGRLRDLGGRRGMNHMLKYLTEHPEKGLLGYETYGVLNVQYWRSFEHLEASPRTPTTRTSRLAQLLEAGRETTGPGSGTRPTSCAPASTRRSTGTCRRTGSARRPRW